MSAMAAPVRVGERVIGFVTIAGPLVRLTGAHMAAQGKVLMQTAAEAVAAASAGSALFKRRAA